MYTLEELQDGKVFIIDKPLDWTSFDVVNKIRWNIRKAHGLKKFKVGHAGTLDPKATGVLVICAGKKTKEISEFQNEDKTYTGTIKLGATTESFDTEKPEIEFFSTDHITEEIILKTAKTFEGEFQQFPPVHSAIKKDGKKLYELARAGKETDVEARKIHIHYFRITGIEMPLVHFEVECSKGTYIRSLANDFGKALNSGGYLTALRRTRSGNFSIEEAENRPLEADYFISDETK